MPDYRRNHYVPEWYQRRFLAAERTSNELFYLDLRPGYGIGAKGRPYPQRSLRRLGPRYCFKQDDLYTTYLQAGPSTDLERYFFGAIDTNGKRAVECFADFSLATWEQDALHNLLDYIGTQKLRTPKGLQWLRAKSHSRDRNHLLATLTAWRRMYSAVWSECVWLIADADSSPTKFLVTDHPVTVYNRRCGPHSVMCRGVADPDVRLHATHTLFPLSLNKILILTNRSWVRNPYQNETDTRPNPALNRGAYFNLLDLQTERHLSEREVLEINFVLKSRAHRYIAAAEEEWLYPERQVSKTDWAVFGDGYLLMPDPRPINMGGTIYTEWASGRADASDEYGRKPWDPAFESGAGDEERAALLRFQGEFARRFGRQRRGRTRLFGELDPESYDERTHARHLEQEQVGKSEMVRLRGRRQ